MRPRHVLLSCLATLLLATSAATQPADGAAESSQLIDRMLDALGGREAIAAVRSLSAEARCTGPGGDFDTWIDSFRPGLTYFRQETDDGAAEIWSTGESTWHLDGEGAVTELPGPTRYFVRSHEFHLLLFEIESRFSDHHLGAWSEVGARRCREIEMTDGSGQPASLCVAESDGLPLRLEMNPQGAQGPVNITFGDWREIGDVWYFFHFDLTEGSERTFTYDYERLEPDTVDALRFVRPAALHQREEQEALLDLLRSDRRAHLETDAAAIAANVAATLVEVSSGAVSVSSRQEVESLFTTVFDGADYELWEDTEPPKVRLSRDSSMAWVVRRVRVRRQAPGPDGDRQLQEFTSAYTATYERRDGRWLMTSVTSTFPSP